MRLCPENVLGGWPGAVSENFFGS